MISIPQPVFVVGSWRSGTTITAKLLNHLPGVCIAKETGFITESLHLLQQVPAASALTPLLAQVNSWLQTNGWAGRVTIGGFRDFCNHSGLHGPRAFLYYVWTLDCTQPFRELRFVGDNTPLYVLAIPQLLEMLPDARFIHVVRDPRDVVCSTLDLRFGAHNALVAALEWNSCLGAWLMAERYLDAGVFTSFRYEDLCSAPAAVMQQLSEFLECPDGAAEAALERQMRTPAASSEFSKVAESAHHRNLSNPLSPARVGRYLKSLSAEQIREIEVTARSGMLAYGYEPQAAGLHPLATEDRGRIMQAMIRDLCRRLLFRIRGR